MAEPQPVDELEQTAHMTDAEAVRRVFDANNAVWTAIQATIFAVANGGLLIYASTSGKAPPMSRPLAFIMMLVSVFAAWVSMQLTNTKRLRATVHPIAQVISRNLTDWIVGYFLVQFAVFAYIGGRQGPMIWGSLFPWMLLGLRMSFIRRLAFYGSFYAMTMFFLYLREPKFGPRDFVAFIFTYGIAMTIGSLNSRRVRRKTIEEFSERRTSAREQLRMRDELRYAREVQLSMLPEAPPSLGWADVAGTSIPATEVGGDYFDYIEADDCLAVVSGDVAGHGMASGITLSALRGAITLLRHSFANPAKVLEQLHEVIMEVSRRRTLVTFNATLFDPQRSLATIASAGHPPVLIRRAAGSVETIELFGPPLGVRLSDGIPQREVGFASGDVFLLHSDGIYESTNPAGEQYGLERLTRLLAKSDGTAAEVRDAVLRGVEEFRGNAPQLDDITVVVVRIK